MPQQFIKQYLDEAEQIIKNFDVESIDNLINLLAEARNKSGRVFVLGIGGSAANASHMVNDLRKITGLEAYTPVDNVSELTARTNDHGFESVFSSWLETSKLKPEDVIFILSVGGGHAEKKVSVNLIEAISFAKQVGAKVVGIVGPKGGHTAETADVCVIIPEGHPERITPHSESFQAVIWHLVVSDPRLKAAQTKWESMAK